MSLFNLDGLWGLQRWVMKLRAQWPLPRASWCRTAERWWGWGRKMLRAMLSSDISFGLPSFRGPALRWLLAPSYFQGAGHLLTLLGFWYALVQMQEAWNFPLKCSPKKLPQSLHFQIMWGNSQKEAKAEASALVQGICSSVLSSRQLCLSKDTIQELSCTADNFGKSHAFFSFFLKGLWKKRKQRLNVQGESQCELKLCYILLPS